MIQSILIALYAFEPTAPPRPRRSSRTSWAVGRRYGSRRFARPLLWVRCPDDGCPTDSSHPQPPPTTTAPIIRQFNPIPPSPCTGVGASARPAYCPRHQQRPPPIFHSKQRQSSPSLGCLANSHPHRDPIPPQPRSSPKQTHATIHGRCPRLPPRPPWAPQQRTDQVSHHWSRGGPCGGHAGHAHPGKQQDRVQRRRTSPGRLHGTLRGRAGAADGAEGAGGRRRDRGGGAAAAAGVCGGRGAAGGVPGLAPGGRAAAGCEWGAV